MALNSELDDLLEDLGVDDGNSRSASQGGSADAGSTSASSSTASSSPLNRWRVKTRGLMQKARSQRQQRQADSSEEEDDDDPLASPSSGRKKSSSSDVRNVLGGGFSFRKVTGWSSPSRTNKSDLREVLEIIDNTVRSTRARLRTEDIIKAVSQELGQTFNPRTWTEWFNIKVDEAYERRENSGDSAPRAGQGSGITKSTTRTLTGRGRRQEFDDDDDETSTESDSEDDSPIRGGRGRRGSSGQRQQGGRGTGMGRQSPSRRQLVDDETESEEEEEMEDLASAPFSEFRMGVFCTVLPAADATKVSREVRKQRRIKTQIWGSMQEQHGEQTGRIIMVNEEEELVKLQFPQADLWFAYEALDLTEDQRIIRSAHQALRAANAQTPPSMQRRTRGKPNFGSAAAALAQKSLQRHQEVDDDADSDDDMRQHFQETTEQIEEVTVQFDEGPLGMGFGWDGEHLEVFKFNLTSSGEKGQAELSESIMIGDLLVAVNDRPLSGLTKSEVINILKTTPRPMACTFRGIPAQ